MGFLGSPVGQEAGSTPLARVEPARSGDFKFTRVNKLSLKVSSSSSARRQNVTMLRSTTHFFGLCCGWSCVAYLCNREGLLGNILRFFERCRNCCCSSKFVFFNNINGSAAMGHTRHHSRVVNHGTCHRSLDTREMGIMSSEYKHDFCNNI